MILKAVVAGTLTVLVHYHQLPRTDTGDHWDECPHMRSGMLIVGCWSTQGKTEVTFLLAGIVMKSLFYIDIYEHPVCHYEGPLLS